MSLQRVSVSVPLVDRTVDPTSLIPVFHDWIRRSAVEGLLIDVARYAHVHHGPGVMLIGHEGDYSVDLAGGGPALRYTLKRDNHGTPAELVARAAGRLAAARDALVSDTGIETRDDQLTVSVFDRLVAPNTPESVERLLPAVRESMSEVFGERLGIEHGGGDSRGPVTFLVRFASAAE